MNERDAQIILNAFYREALDTAVVIPGPMITMKEIQMNERDKAKEMAEVMLHWASGGECEYSYDGEYFICTEEPIWDWDSYDYRIKDPYAELKAAAKDPTKQIRIKKGNWHDVGYHWEFDSKVENYEIRDKPKATKKVKLLAWFNGSNLFWETKNQNSMYGCTRVPSEDKEIEVEE